jgi:hypothetical protein
VQCQHGHIPADLAPLAVRGLGRWRQAEQIFGAAIDPNTYPIRRDSYSAGLRNSG